MGSDPRNPHSELKGFSGASRSRFAQPGSHFTSPTQNNTKAMKTNLTVNSNPALSFSRPVLRRAALVLGIALSAASVHAQTYTLVAINPPAGSVGRTVAGMNNHGAVVGATTVKSGKNTVAGPA